MGDDVTTTELLLGAVGSLSVVITVLWKQQQSMVNDLRIRVTAAEKSNAKCAEDRRKLWESHEHLQKDNDRLKSLLGGGNDQFDEGAH